MSSRSEAPRLELKTRKFNVNIAVGLVGTLALVIMALVFPYVFVGFGFVFIAAGVIFCIGYYDRVLHQRRLNRLDIEERQAAIRVKQVVSTPHDGIVIVNPNLAYTHIEPVSRKQIKQPEALALPETTGHIPNILDVIPGWKMPVVISGPQQSGKTNSTAAIAKSLGISGIFVGFRNEPQYHLQEFTVYSEEIQSGSIEMGLSACLTSLNNYEPQILILDDFVNYAAVVQSGIVDTFIAMAATQAMSHNKRVFFTMQATTKQDFNLRGGAQLKNNFALLEVPAPVTDEAYQVIGHATTGMLYEPGDWKTGKPVRLPGKFISDNHTNVTTVDEVELFKQRLSSWSKKKLIQTYTQPGHDNPTGRSALYKLVCNAGAQDIWQSRGWEMPK